MPNPRELTARQVEAHYTRHPLQESAWNGCRDDVEPWRRRGKGGDPLADDLRIRSSSLIEAVEWMHARRGREWTPRDEELMRELEQRAFGWGEVQRQRLWSVPSWVTAEIVPPRRMGGYQRFLAVLVHAFRQGAVGVLLSYEECMSLCDVSSRTTWQRWCQEWERLGLVRIVQTWAEDTEHPSRPRKHARLLYRVGPALEGAAGYGIVEGAAPDEKRGRWAERAAMGARAKARKVRNERKAELYARARPEASPVGAFGVGDERDESAPQAPTARPAPVERARIPEDPPMPEAPAHETSPETAHTASLPDCAREAVRDQPEGDENPPSKRVGSRRENETARARKNTRNAPVAEIGTPGGASASPSSPLLGLHTASVRERSGRPGGAGAGSLCSPRGTRCARAGHSPASADDPASANQPPNRATVVGASDEGAHRAPRPGTDRGLDALWDRLERSEATDPALREAVRRWRRRERS